MSPAFHDVWLTITPVVIGTFGPVFFLGTIEGTAEPARWALDLPSWPLGGMQSDVDGTAHV